MKFRLAFGDEKYSASALKVNWNQRKIKQINHTKLFEV